MRIICKKDNLLDAINIVSKAVTSRTTLPILECILLTATEEGLRLTSNDLEMGIETALIEATIVEEGSVALEARIFSEIIRRLPNNEEVSIYSDENNITMINCKKTEFKIIGQFGDEFPKLPNITKNDKYVFDANELKEMIRKTVFSVSIDESKPVLTGELFEIENNKLNIVAVDGFRVSYRIDEFKDPVDDISVVIPSKTLNELTKLIKDSDKEIIMYFTDKHVLFEMEDYTIVSRLLDGEFLKYKQIFTEEYTTNIKIDVKKFVLSLERATLISTDIRRNPVKLEIGDSKLIITANTEMGTSYDEIEIELEGEALEIAFNPRYLIDALKAIDDDIVNINFTTSLSPCTILGEEPHDYKYLVLPLRLKA